MPHPAFPVDADISAFVTTAGVELPAGFSFAGYGASVQEEWQRRTGREPFLKDATDVTRYYDPPRMSNKDRRYSSLELDNGLLSCTSVAIGVHVVDNPDGTLLTLNEDYRLMPLNAPVTSKPYEWIEFFFRVRGLPGSIKVIGQWGYCTSIPEDAWQGMLALGGAQACRAILQGLMATPAKIKSASGAEIQQDSFEDLGAAWEKQANRVIARYTMLQLGLD